jgi:hypothetical protein
MNALLTPFRQLVDRKLWPLAILLIAALVAVPMLLASDDAGTPVGPIANAGPAGAGAQSPTQPIVTLGEAADRERHRKVLGARKNPFEPAVKAKPAKTATASQSGDAGGTPADGKGGGGKGGSEGSEPAGGGSSQPAGPVVEVTPAIPAKPKRTYELFQLKIRFGSTASTDLANRSVKRLTALPRMADPVLVYMGLKQDKRTAVFLVDANTLVVGDGKCVPAPTNCQNLELKKGQTAFVDVLDATGKSVDQYQLDYVKVLRRTVTDAKAAKVARRAVAKGGRDALRANMGRVNGWMYDDKTGVLHPPTKK